MYWQVCLAALVFVVEAMATVCTNCPSYNPTSYVTTVTSTKTTTTTSTVFTGSASTSYVFVSGNPPEPTVVPRYAAPEPTPNVLEVRDSCTADNCLRALRRHTAAAFCSTYTKIVNTATTALPTYIPSECVPSRISSACSCLTASTTACTCPPAPTTRTVTIPATSTVVITQTRAALPVVQTIYPCPTPLPANHAGPTYGDESGLSFADLSNTLYGSTTPEGASAEACCNTCLFEIPNCVQGYWYFYEGCVVSQALGTTGSGKGISSTCPSGIFAGLSYGPDVAPAFQSTGNFIGPCGQSYLEDGA